MRLINREFLFFFSVLCSLFSRIPWSSIVLLLFAEMGVRKDRISVIFAFLQGPMSVRSGKFSVSEQIKNSTHSAIQESVHCILRKATSRFHFLVEKVYVQTAIRLSLTQRNRRIRLAHVRSVLQIGRDSVMNNRKPRKFAPKSSILRTPFADVRKRYLWKQ